jgi:glycerol-3-phosphate cytidylyltransferase
MIIGFTASAFDLLHAGHIAMLREAKSQCDYLICGLHVDPSLDRMEKNTPVQSTVERYTQLSAVKYVDEVVPYLYEKELTEILTSYKIDVRILGDEYKDVEFTGRELCDRLGIRLYFNSRDHDYSTSDLRTRIHSAEVMKGSAVNSEHENNYW